MLPHPNLPWFTYCGVIDDLGEYIKKRVPIGHRSIVVFARRIALKTNIDLVSDYHNIPAQLVVVCDTLDILNEVRINLSGNDAPDFHSFSEQPGNHAWTGKAGCKGGSAYFYVLRVVRNQKLEIDVHGGKGGRGQSGYIGKPGQPGDGTSMSIATMVNPLMSGLVSTFSQGFKNNPGQDGEAGGDGGTSGDGGDGGEVKFSMGYPKEDFIWALTMKTRGGDGGSPVAGGRGGGGGMGGAQAFASRGARGSNGRNGSRGTAGKKGKNGEQDLIDFQGGISWMVTCFPLTAVYLQRALNWEIKCSVQAKSKNNQSQLDEICDNIAWIGQVAKEKKYDVIAKLCTDTAAACKKSEHHFRQSSVKLDTDLVKTHMEDMKDMARTIVGCGNRFVAHFHVLNNPKVAKHAKHARFIHNMEGVFNSHKARLAEINTLLSTGGSGPESLEPRIARGLNTPFSEHVGNALKEAEETPFMTAIKLHGRMSVSSASTEAPSEAGTEASTGAASEAPSEATSWLSDPMEFSTEVSDPSEYATAVEGPSESGTEYESAASEGGTEYESAASEGGTEYESAASEGGTEYESALDEEDLAWRRTGGRLATRTAFDEGPTAMTEVEEGVGETAAIGEEAAGEGAAVLSEAGVALGAEAVVAPELVVVEAVAMVAIVAICAYLSAQQAALTLYETAVKTRLRLMARNRLRLKMDKKEPDPPPPRRRGKKESESGIYIGVLDKCEPVDGNPSQMVATFDSIHLQFTTKEEEDEGKVKADLNELDEVQIAELAEQLEVQRMPFSPSPAFLMITTISAGEVNEESVGQWFEFEAEFTGSRGQSEAIEITSLNAFFKGKPQHSFSGVTNASRPVTITSVRRLNPSVQAEVEQTLGLNALSMAGLSLGAGSQPQLAFARGRGGGRGGRKVKKDGGKGRKAPTARALRSISRVLVANVGQGSCNVFFDRNNRVKLVFDAGFGNVELAKSVIGYIRSSPIIVISHWDLDHYRFLLSDSSLTLGKMFIVPSFGATRGVFVRRVYSSIRDKISYGSNNTSSFAKLSCPIPNLDLRMTTVRRQGWDKNNLNAITACIKDSQGRPLFLLPGDASYSYVAPDLLEGLKYLVATHHGSTRSLIGSTASIPTKRGGAGGSIIFSYGLRNMYGHNVDRAMPFYIPKGWNNPQITANSFGGVNTSLY